MTYFQQRNYFRETGREATSRALRHVNILSEEIDQITEKTTVKEGPKVFLSVIRKLFCFLF